MSGHQVLGEQIHGPPAREVPSLADLGFETKFHRQVKWGVDGVQTYYVIREVGRIPQIAVLSVIDDTHVEQNHTTLFVFSVSTLSDSRSDARRPRARDIFASFWVDMGRSLRDLRTLYFHNVVESTTRDVVRDEICPLIMISYDRLMDSPGADFILRMPEFGVNDSWAQAWRLLCEESRLMRSAIGMPGKFPMAAPGEDLQVVRVDAYQGVDEHGNPAAFDLEVSFGKRPSGS